MAACVAALLAAIATSSSPQIRAPALKYVSITSDSFMMEKLPISYCATWPLWCASNEDGALKMRNVNPTAGADDDEAASLSWVNPITFEDLWLPEDLPLPTFHLALTLVLKDGVPRYVSPAVDSTVFADGREWRNRGLCSVPLAKTWLPWRHIPMGQMRISAYVHPPVPGGEDETAAAPKDAPPCEPLAVLLPVESAFALAAEALAEAPSELASGFAYLTVRLPLGEEARLGSELLRPGCRLRVFLSDADSFPAAIDADEDSWAWERGECDVRLTQISAGGSSAYLPEVYRPLYGQAP